MEGDIESTDDPKGVKDIAGELDTLLRSILEDLEKYFASRLILDGYLKNGYFNITELQTKHGAASYSATAIPKTPFHPSCTVFIGNDKRFELKRREFNANVESSDPKSWFGYSNTILLGLAQKNFNNALLAATEVANLQVKLLEHRQKYVALFNSKKMNIGK